MEPKKLDHYLLQSQLGAGGMGEVYLALDERLQRNVAIKILPEELVGEETARKRFRREALALSKLNHPNIETVHDFGSEGDTQFLVVEYIQGEGLESKIKQGPIPESEVLRLGLELLDGVVAAHGAKVIHRDIKPANLRLTSDGHLKILDFGLARLAPDAGEHLSAAETVTATRTVAGTIPYMSPEQLRAGEVDSRSDLWSIGVVLYEMVTGRRPFEGSGPVALCDEILHKQPVPPGRMVPGISSYLEEIILKCLEKDPGLRYQRAIELQTDLKRLATASLTGITNLTSEPKPSGRRFLWPALAAVSIVVAAGSIWYWGDFSSSPDREVMQFISPLPEGYTFDAVGFSASAVAIAPDGSEIVFAARDKEGIRLFRQKIGDFSATAIPGTERGRAPFFSRDGKWIGFSVGQEVKRVSLEGDRGASAEFPLLGTVEVAFFGGDFSDSGDPIVVSECTRGLRLFHLARQPKDNVTDVFEGSSGQHQFPQVLPGGQGILYTDWSPERSSLVVLRHETGEKKVVLNQASYGRYVPTGHLVYVWEGDLYGVAFDLKALQVVGDPVRVLTGVLQESIRGAAHFAVSDNGTLVYIPGGTFNNVPHLARVDFSGVISELPGIRGQALAMAPDGHGLMTQRWRETIFSNPWIFEFERGVWQQLFDGPGDENWPIWSPDGTRVAFFRNVKPDDVENNGIFVRSLKDGSEARLVSYRLNEWTVPGSWTPDGQKIAFVKDVSGEGPNRSIWEVSVAGLEEPSLLVSSQAIHPAFSPDGRWLAYASRDSGAWQVMIRSYPEPSEKIQISTEPAVEPVWSHDGRTLYYRAVGGRSIMAVSLGNGDRPTPSQPAVVVEGEFAGAQVWGLQYRLGPDGKSFYSWMRPEPLPPATSYRVILNWFDELKEKVGRGGS